MISLIAAKSKNNIIGIDGRIPWKVPGEQLQFKSLTMGNVVIMGRNTYEEIGKPLPGRLNIVVSRTKEFAGKDLLTASSLANAISMVGSRNIFIAGGEQLYRAAMDIVDLMYITEVDLVVDPHADYVATFPSFDRDQFFEYAIGNGNGPVSYLRKLYIRKN